MLVRYFKHEVDKARCPLKEKVEVNAGVVSVDTTKFENMEECTVWSETEECSRKSLYMLEKTEVEDKKLLHKLNLLHSPY